MVSEKVIAILLILAIIMSIASIAITISYNIFSFDFLSKNKEITGNSGEGSISLIVEKSGGEK